MAGCPSFSADRRRGGRLLRTEQRLRSAVQVPRNRCAICFGGRGAEDHRGEHLKELRQRDVGRRVGDRADDRVPLILTSGCRPGEAAGLVPRVATASVA